MKYNISYLILSLQLFAIQALSQTITVVNPTATQRQELVEIKLQDISMLNGLKTAEPFSVVNSAGQEVDFQLTSDGKLLIDASVMPHGKTEFKIEQRTPFAMLHPQYGDHGWQSIATGTAAGGYGVGKMWSSGRHYPDRLDDIAWENDRGAYRVYGPAFQQSGGIGYGPDIWVKNTPSPDIDRRFRMDIDIKPTQRQLEDSGRKAEAERLVQDNSFHVDHGTGNDCYAVGATLGCGAPAILLEKNGRLPKIKADYASLVPVYPQCWSNYEILDNGPLRFTLALTFADTIINNTLLREHRIYSLDKGSNFNRVEVWYEQIGESKKKNDMLTVCAGFPLHSPNEHTLITGKNFIQYADPTDNPSYNNCELYVACLFPYDSITATTTFGHAVGVVNKRISEHLLYYAGSAWSKYDVRNQREWQVRIETQLDAINNPLVVEIHP